MPLENERKSREIMGGEVEGVKFSDTLSLEDLKSVADEYAKLVCEHADLFHFKEVATKYLTAEQLEEIENELEDIPEVGY